MPRISSKNQVTLPAELLRRTGLTAGDQVAIEAEGSDRIVVRRRTEDFEEAIGVFDGLYEANYLGKLRAGERA